MTSETNGIKFSPQKWIPNILITLQVFIYLPTKACSLINLYINVYLREQYLGSSLLSAQSSTPSQ